MFVVRARDSFQSEATDVPASSDALEAALETLRSLHEGYRGVLEAVACGPPAVDRLAEILSTPDPSGLFEVRCRAAAALRALGAVDALLNFLRMRHDLPDPVAMAGEEAVVSEAARALQGVEDDRILPTLSELAFWRPLSGVIATLGALEDPRAIPPLVEGLREDHTRRAAEVALLRQGEASVHYLLDLARAGGAPDEAKASLRLRRSAAGMLPELPAAPDALPLIRALARDADPEVSAQACRAALTHADPTAATPLISRLRELEPRLRDPLRRCVRELLRQATVGSASRR